MEYQYRYFLAGFLAIPFIMVMTDENPLKALGDGWAWVLHLGGCLMLSSTIGLIVGWALQPRGKRPA
jgi:hypothetical protein